MARFERCAIQMKVFHGGGAFGVVPTIGQQNAADIEKNHVEGEHRRLSF
jgi:hypothetical protein